jgi:hypothetical protein
MLFGLAIGSVAALLHHCDHPIERLEDANVGCND